MFYKLPSSAKIPDVKRFSYNPNGESVGHDSLNHNEVIKMGSQFIATEDTLQEILISKYPILLIDESQDTKKELVDSFFQVCAKHKAKFILGMFGDTMQKIYMDGKDRLENSIPEGWERPKKIMNHRSASRIVNLANAIRSTIDGQKQRARSDAEEGIVRLFITSSATAKEEFERNIAKTMFEDTGDAGWQDESTYKSLILEHHMAASRFGFINLYEPLNKSGEFDTPLRDGSIPELSFLANVVSPLVKASLSGNDFEVLKIIRCHSPLFERKTFAAECDQISILLKVEKAVESLIELWKNGKTPSCLDALESIKEHCLFKLGNHVNEILMECIDGEDTKVSTLRKALASPFDELEKYSAYVSGNTRFATHQGVKGLEFPRVMVIMDDIEARGNNFSYDKLFGAKPKTDTDIKNERENKDTTIMRTTRLFYVACTRAQKSLAIVAYSNNTKAVKLTAIKNKWFTEDEIRIC
ncbi:MAG: UvrD-helicase domain-containing protein [Deltaproteobacteria bacterium]|nr:UvrD-helicase domain-containing protein [Deltaproteobacteria bacterium]